MAANVETMFYVRETPWHGLGTKVMHAPDSKNALKMADYYMENLGMEFEELRKKKLDDRKVKEYIEVLIPYEDSWTPQQKKNNRRMREDLAGRV